MSGVKDVVTPIQLDLNTKIIVFGWYAEGYYSGATLFKSMILPEEQYEQFKIDRAFEGVTDYVCELDGKHSEVESDFEKYTTTVKELLLDDVNYKFVVDNNLDFEDTNDKWFNELFGENGPYEFNLYDLGNHYRKQLVSLKKETVIYKILVNKNRLDDVKKLLGEHLEDNVACY